MYQIVEQIAGDVGVSVEQADFFFAAIVAYLLNKVPELEHLVDTVFTQSDPDILRTEINHIITLFEQQKMRDFTNWTMPEQTIKIREGKNDLF